MIVPESIVVETQEPLLQFLAVSDIGFIFSLRAKAIALSDALSTSQ